MKNFLSCFWLFPDFIGKSFLKNFMQLIKFHLTVDKSSNARFTLKLRKVSDIVLLKRYYSVLQKSVTKVNIVTGPVFEF